MSVSDTSTLIRDDDKHDSGLAVEIPESATTTTDGISADEAGPPDEVHGDRTQQEAERVEQLGNVESLLVNEGRDSPTDCDRSTEILSGA